MSSRPNAHRCTRCDINWPWTRTYAETCPLCGGETWIAAEAPMSLDEARVLQNDVAQARDRRQAFEDYCRRHDVLTCSCGEANIVVDEIYGICPTCDRPGPWTIDDLGGMDAPLPGGPNG